MTHFKKITKVIDNKERSLELNFILFLNFINFILEILTILSIPIFASVLVDKNYLLNKFDILIPNFLLGFDIIILVSVLVASLFLIKNLFYVFLIYIQSSLIKKIKVNISEKVFNQYLLGTYANHLQKNPSTITRDVTYSVQSFGFYLFYLINLFREVISVLFIILLLVFVKPFIVLLSGIFLSVITFLFTRKFKKPLSKRANQNQELNKVFTKEVLNIFLSIKDVKILQKESDVIKKFKSKIDIYENNIYFFQILEKLPKAILELVSIIFILVMSITLFSVSSNQNELFILLSLFVVAIVRLLPSFTSITTSINYLKIFEPSLINLYNQISTNAYQTANRKDYKEKILDEDTKNLIVVDKLNFGYQNENLNLKDLDLKIKRGEMNCIIGETGSGKSTLFNLMLGLLEPKNGNIFYKNKNIMTNISKWYDDISLVSQDPYLLEDTIIKNITFNISDEIIDKTKLQNAIKITELQETIAKLPNGLNTQINALGINLSGGEKQRIALARAIYKDSEIFFLDEFTNAIDDLTENKIMQNLKKLDNKTFIIISHKKNTIDRCDKIWKLHNGNISLIKF